jgi:solute:Na+ symporter, SSS family
VTPVALGLFAYIALQLVVGAAVSGRIRTEDDYLVAGRSLGPGLASASIFATWFGAETCVGAAGEVYRGGLRLSLSDPFGYGLCLLLFGLFLARPLWQRGITTLADLFRDRFSPGVERLVALLLIPSSLLWAGAQIRAFGHVVAESTGYSLELGIAIATGTAVTYTVFGGLLADAYTDVLQGLVLVVCLLVLTITVVANAGGLGPTLALLSRAREGAPRASAFALLDAWIVPAIGSLFAQELVARAVASRSARVSRASSLTAALVYTVVGMLPVVLGAIARETSPGHPSEAVLSRLAYQHLDTLGFVVLSGALVSAILSTVDSALLAVGALVSHNLAPLVLDRPSDAQRLRIARGSVVVLGSLAFGLAHAGSSVHALAHAASSVGTAGIFVAGMFGLHTRFGDRRAAYSSLLSGPCTWLFVQSTLGAEYAFACSLAVALVSYLLVARAAPHVVEL